MLQTDDLDWKRFKSRPLDAPRSRPGWNCTARKKRWHLVLRPAFDILKPDVSVADFNGAIRTVFCQRRFARGRSCDPDSCAGMILDAAIATQEAQPRCPIAYFTQCLKGQVAQEGETRLGTDTRAGRMDELFPQP